MKRRFFLKSALPAAAAGTAAVSCAKQPEQAARKKLFSFVQYSDVHVQPDRGAKEGFLAAIEKINSLKPDFAIGSGDLVMDSLAADEERANTLYDLYIECRKSFTVPVHDVMGNHEVFGLYVPDKVPLNHPDWGKELFKRRLGDGKTYRSFNHKGVHFLLLDSIGIEDQPNEKGQRPYYGLIGAEQLAWLEQDLASVPKETPIIGVAHIPIFTWFEQFQNGPTFPSGKGSVINDAKQFLDMMKDRRLIGFLEGHIHVNERFDYMNMRFVDTGAVCGAWWGGPRNGHPEGFNLIHVYDDGIENEYTTYGWDASKYKQAKLDPNIFPLAGRVTV